MSDELKQKFRAMASGAQNLAVAYIGVVNALFPTLRRLGAAAPEKLAEAANMDAAYVRRWCDAAYAFGYLEAEGEAFRLGESGMAMLADAPDTLMPLAAQARAEHPHGRTRRRTDAQRRAPGRKGHGRARNPASLVRPDAGGNFRRLLRKLTICPALPIFSEIDARGGLVVDLGCGNGWYLRALARRYRQFAGSRTRRF